MLSLYSESLSVGPTFSAVQIRKRSIQKTRENICVYLLPREHTVCHYRRNFALISDTHVSRLSNAVVELHLHYEP